MALLRTLFLVLFSFIEDKRCFWREFGELCLGKGSLEFAHRGKIPGKRDNAEMKGRERRSDLLSAYRWWRIKVILSFNICCARGTVVRSGKGRELFAKGTTTATAASTVFTPRCSATPLVP
jgi:hypothetical protein